MKHSFKLLSFALVIICLSLTSPGSAQVPTEQDLVFQLLDLDNTIRIQAETQLINLGEQAIPALTDALELLDQEYDFLRRNVARILGKIHSTTAIPNLLKTITHDPNPLVKATAINSLEGIAQPTPEVLQTLEKALLDSSSQVQIAAADGLRKFGKQALASHISLTLLTGAADPQVAWAAQRALLAIAPGTFPLQPETIEQIVERLVIPIWQDLGITVLARAQATTFEPLMKRAIDTNESPMIRVPVLQSIKAMNISDLQKLAPIQQLLKDLDQPFLVRTIAAEILGKQELNPLSQAIYQEQIAIQVENLASLAYHPAKVVAIIGFPLEQNILEVEQLTIWSESGTQIPAIFTPLSYWSQESGAVRTASVTFYPELSAYERAVFFVNLQPGQALNNTHEPQAVVDNSETRVSIAQPVFQIISDIIFEPADHWVTQLIVAADQSSYYSSVQAAINSIPENNTSRVMLYVKPGTYHEKILFPANKPFISLIGEDPENTILSFNETAANVQFSPDELYKTWGAASTIILSNDFTAERITFDNSSLPGTGQAQAVRIDSDRVFFHNCRFISHQDTVFANGDGRQYYLNCYVEGDVDFIYGSATAVFENCQIINNRRTGGYITAASTPAERQFGFVFINCEISGDVNRGSVWLGRPWRDYAHTAFINCYMSNVIQPGGWHNWGSTAKEKTARYEEFNSNGPGANPQGRVSWSRQLTVEEASLYTTENILSGSDHWLPKVRDF